MKMKCRKCFTEIKKADLDTYEMGGTCPPCWEVLEQRAKIPLDELYPNDRDSLYQENFGRGAE